MLSRMRGREQGLTYIEMLVAVSVLAILCTAIVPIARWDEKRRRERHLKMTLQTMRDAIDMYKRYADEGLIQQSDVEQMGYPLDLDELIEGVDVASPTSPNRARMQFLRRIPVDPITGEVEWGFRSYQDDWDSTSWGRENIYDVYSLAPGIALDGTSYADW